jgi:hypothetical protein
MINENIIFEQKLNIGIIRYKFNKFIKKFKDLNITFETLKSKDHFDNEVILKRSN